MCQYTILLMLFDFFPQDIGTWQTLFRLTANIAVVSNTAIIAFSSQQLDRLIPNTSLLTQVLVAIAVEHAVITIKYVISTQVRSVPSHVRIAVARRERESSVRADAEATRKAAEAAAALPVHQIVSNDIRLARRQSSMVIDTGGGSGDGSSALLTRAQSLAQKRRSLALSVDAAAIASLSSPQAEDAH